MRRVAATEFRGVPRAVGGVRAGGGWRFPCFRPVGIASRRLLEREVAAQVGPADRAAEVLAAQGARVAPCRAAGEGRRQDPSAPEGAPHGATSGLVRAVCGQAEAPRGEGRRSAVGARTGRVPGADFDRGRAGKMNGPAPNK